MIESSSNEVMRKFPSLVILASTKLAVFPSNVLLIWITFIYLKFDCYIEYKSNCIGLENKTLPGYSQSL